MCVFLRRKNSLQNVTNKTRQEIISTRYKIKYGTKTEKYEAIFTIIILQFHSKYTMLKVKIAGNVTPSVPGLGLRVTIAGVGLTEQSQMLWR